MFKLVSDFFAGLKMTIVSGVCLIISLILMLTKIKVVFDPAWITVVLSGYPLLYLAITRLFKQKWISSCLLISIAMVASLAIGELFAAGEVAFIMAIGAILEDKTVEKAQKGLTELIRLAPVKARRLREANGVWQEETVKAEEVRIGDLLRVLPGETIPVDGVIVKGESAVDQSIMTGESLPVDKAEGDSVFCGTMNGFGSVDIQATGVGQDSTLQKLIAMVREADEKKAPMQRLADQWAVWLVPIALLIAVGAVVVNLILGMPFMEALTRGVTVLVVFCPCALALATPTSIMAAIGQATKHGVIVKSGEALEAMGRVDTIAFDKTGTLTDGQLRVGEILSFGGMEDKELLSFAGAAEARSEHPLGKAISACARERGVNVSEADNFVMEAGRGVSAVVEGRKVLCGNEAYLLKNGVEVTEDMKAQMQPLRDEGKAIVCIALDGACIGAAALSDGLRPYAKESVAELQAMDTRCVLLTGDDQRAADYFAKKTGITDIRAQLLPSQKVEAVEKLRQEGGRLCMIGDGVNDAPALKTADVGVAMGGMGSDVAVEASDIAIMTDDLTRLVYLKRLARSTVRTIKGNITASMCINAVAVTLSVLGVLTPVTGALVHNAGSCLVVLNAALLYDRNFESKKK